LADFPFRWALRLVSLNGETIVADLEKWWRRKEPDRDVPYFLFGHRPVLWSRSDVGQTDKFSHCGILALVGSAFMGRRFLRSICNRGYGIPVRSLRIIET